MLQLFCLHISHAASPCQVKTTSLPFWKPGLLLASPRLAICKGHVYSTWAPTKAQHREKGTRGLLPQWVFFEAWVMVRQYRPPLPLWPLVFLFSLPRSGYRMDMGISLQLKRSYPGKVDDL